jgi:hypothetical protein
MLKILLILFLFSSNLYARDLNDIKLELNFISDKISTLEKRNLTYKETIYRQQQQDKKMASVSLKRSIRSLNDKITENKFEIKRLVLQYNELVKDFNSQLE